MKLSVGEPMWLLGGDGRAEHLCGLRVVLAGVGAVLVEVELPQRAAGSAGSRLRRLLLRVG